VLGDPLTIGDLAVRSGLPTSTLRYYDRIGLILATSRTIRGSSEHPRGPTLSFQWVGR
jgi:MerR family regulatory protein